MKIKLFFITLLLPTFAHAGAISGGGGKGVVCTDPHDGSITSVKLLDLWEAKTLFHQAPLLTTGNLAKDVDTALVALKDSIRFDGSGTVDDTGMVYYNQDYVLAILRVNAAKFLKPNPKLLRLRGVSLSDTDDSKELAEPNSCKVLQLVNYQPGDTIWVNEDLVEKMDEMNKAALIVHESLYTLLRGLEGETNSIRTRRAVGYVFAGNSIVLNKPNIPEHYLSCTSPQGSRLGNVLAVYLKGDGAQEKIEISPQVIGGTPLMGVTEPTFDFPKDSNASDFFVTGICPKKDFSTAVSFFLGGPVEFDRNVGLIFTCKAEELSVYLIAMAPGQPHSEETPLTCKLSDTTALEHQ